MVEPVKNNGGKSVLLQTLASSGNMWVQLSTVVLVVLSGFSNWTATWTSGDQTRKETDKLIQETHTALSNAGDDFRKANIDTNINRRILTQFKEEIIDFETRQLNALKNQAVLLDNQNKILAEQTKLTNELHDWVEKRKTQMEKEGH